MKRAEQDAKEVLTVPPMGEEKPSDAALLPDIIDRRFKDLIAMGLSPKELTDALKAATEWFKVKKESEQGDGYGSRLGKGTMRDG